MIRVILATMAKDLLLLVRDRMSMFFVLMFPVLFGLFTGVVFTGLAKSLRPIRVGIVDQDKSRYSAIFVQDMGQVPDTVPVVTGLAEAENQIRLGTMAGYVLLPDGFGRYAGRISTAPPAVYVKVDAASFAALDRIEAAVFQVMVNLAIRRLEAAQTAAASQPGASVSWPGSAGLVGGVGYHKNALVRIDLLKPGQSPATDPSHIRGVGPSSAFGVSFPPAMIWGIVGCVASFSTSLVREKEKGTFLRLRAAPVRWWAILAGKGLAMFLAVVAILMLLVVLGSFLGVTVTSWTKLALVVGVLGWCFVGIMLALSAAGRTERAVDAAAWSILLVLTMFGGGMVPFEFLPDWMRVVGGFSPMRWSIEAIQGALWQRLTYRELLRPLGLLVVTGAICALGGYRAYQRLGNP